MIIHSNGYNVVKYTPMSLLQMFRSPPESERDRDRERERPVFPYHDLENTCCHYCSSPVLQVMNQQHYTTVTRGTESMKVRAAPHLDNSEGNWLNFHEVLVSSCNVSGIVLGAQQQTSIPQVNSPLRTWDSHHCIICIMTE